MKIWWLGGGKEKKEREGEGSRWKKYRPRTNKLVRKKNEVENFKLVG
jgi:hypothetical protein